MELSQLEAFVAVAREGSFSKAAAALFRTQPAISQTIRRLEEEVGQTLIDRSSRRGLLTEAGRVLFEHAERLLNFKELAIDAVADLQHLRGGRLVIATNELTCLYLMPLLHTFRTQHPAVRLAVHRSLASRIPADVRDYAAELGVVTYRPTDTALDSVMIYRDQLAFVVPHGHRFVRRRQVRIRDLGAESFVAHHVASPYRARVLETFRRRRVTLQMPVEMPTIDAIKRFVAAGHGVALLPAIAVESEVARGELVRLHVPELAFERPIRLIWRKEGVRSHAAAAFLAVARAQAATPRGPFLFAREPAST